MSARFADHLMAMLGVQFDGDGIAHGAGGHVECRFLAGDLGGALLQTVDGGIFTVNVIAHFGFRHRTPHCGRWFGDSVAAQVDDHVVRNSWNTSFETSTPRSVRRSVPPLFSSRPSPRKRLIGASYCCHSSAVGETPSARRRPTKNFSSRGCAGVDSIAGDARSTYSVTASTFCHRRAPSNECASAPNPT